MRFRDVVRENATYFFENMTSSYARAALRREYGEYGRSTERYSSQKRYSAVLALGRVPTSTCYVGYTQAEIGLKVLDGTRLSEYDEYRTVLPTGFKPSTVVL